MPIVGFGFDKLHVERKEQFTKEDKLKNSIQIDSVKETKLKTSDKTEADAILILFSFRLEYGKAGDIDFKGHIIFYESEDKVKEIIDSWNKNKKMPGDFSAFIFNFILAKSNLKALELEEVVGLPLHLKLPKFRIK